MILTVRQQQAKLRAAMSRKYNKKWTVDQFDAGEIVALKIPQELRTSTDNLCLFCIMLDRPHKKAYELQCQHGILDCRFPTKNLERVPETVAQGIAIGNGTKKISLAQAAERESTSNRVSVSCQCKGDCQSKRCRCFKEGFNCTVHCHTEDHICQNVSALPDRTEKVYAKRNQEVKARRTIRARTGRRRAGRAKENKARAGQSGKGQGEKGQSKRLRKDTVGEAIIVAPTR